MRYECAARSQKCTHFFDEDAVRSGLGRSPDRFGKERHRVLKVQIAVGPQELPGRAQVGADIGIFYPSLLHGLPHVMNGGGHDLLYRHPVGCQLGGAGAEGVRGDEPGPGF